MKAARNPYYPSIVGGDAWTVGTKATNTIKVTRQLTDRHGKNLTQRTHVRVWLSDANTGAGVCAVAPDGTVAIAAAGVILNSPVAKLIHEIVTDATGKFDLNITQSTAKTLYVCSMMPDGTISVSPAVTF